MSKPNILLIVSDQERQRDWLPADFPLPNRQRLIDAGLEFTNHYTHSSPCSPSRATLFTGQYMAEHGVTENSTGGANTELSHDAVTLGHLDDLDTKPEVHRRWMTQMLEWGRPGVMEPNDTDV